MSNILKESINKEKLPRHIAVIMDGNGRWAEKRGNKRIFGHKNAVAAVRDTVEASAELGIEYLTLYAFSTENWKRPKNEVDALMSLLVSTIHDETKTLTRITLNCILSEYSELPRNVRGNSSRVKRHQPMRGSTWYWRSYGSDEISVPLKR
jgi:undecaprenyl diphosphate synthase